jgi:outer membrane immunogenic protein
LSVQSAARLNPRPFKPGYQTVSNKPTALTALEQHFSGEKMKRFFAIAAIAALIPVSALAQTPSTNTTKHNSDATNWTGFYAGLNIGGAVGSSNPQTATTYVSGDFFQTTSVPVVNSTGSQNLTPKGYAGGLQFGYNWQFRPKWVLGAEADFGAFVANDSVTGTTVYPCCAPYTFSIAQKVSTDWMSTFRARVGHTVAKRSLLFVSGGAAETQIHYSSLYTDDYDSANESANASVLKTGWIVGAGGEYALNKRWSTRAEYLFADFGTVSNAGTVMTDTYLPSSQSNPFTHTATLKSNIARIAVNYRF